MNKRLKELTKQSGICFGADNQPGGWRTTIHGTDLDLEKFAELIIGNATECVRDVLREEGSTLSYEDCDKIQQRIKEYFGVKK